MNIERFQAIKRLAHKELDVPPAQRQAAIQQLRVELENECRASIHVLGLEVEQLVGSRYEEFENLDPRGEGAEPYIEMKVEQWYRSTKSAVGSEDEIASEATEIHRAEIDDAERYR